MTSTLAQVTVDQDLGLEAAKAGASTRSTWAPTPAAT
jgi:hypothetical protein